MRDSEALHAAVTAPQARTPFFGSEEVKKESPSLEKADESSSKFVNTQYNIFFVFIETKEEKDRSIGHKVEAEDLGMKLMKAKPDILRLQQWMSTRTLSSNKPSSLSRLQSRRLSLGIGKLSCTCKLHLHHS